MAETAQEFSNTVLHQIGLNIIERSGQPGDFVATAMLCYRADPEFWARHLQAALGGDGDRMAAEQAKIDGITVEFRNAVRKAERRRLAKGR